MSARRALDAIIGLLTFIREADEKGEEVIVPRMVTAAPAEKLALPAPAKPKKYHYKKKGPGETSNREQKFQDTITKIAKYLGSVGPKPFLLVYVRLKRPYFCPFYPSNPDAEPGRRTPSSGSSVRV